MRPKLRLYAPAREICGNWRLTTGDWRLEATLPLIIERRQATLLSNIEWSRW